MADRFVSIIPGLVAGLALGATIAGCSAENTLPALPDIALQDPARRTELNRALEKVNGDPLDPDVNAELGMTLATSGQSTAAATMFERARALAPDDYRWAYLHGLVLEELGDAPAAAAAIANAIYLNGRYVPARVKLAALKLTAGDPEGSASLLGALLITHDNRADVHFVAGRVQEALGNLDGARRHFERALELNGPFGDGHSALASVYGKQNRDAQAAQQLALYETYRERKLRVADPVRVIGNGSADGDEQHIAHAKAMVRSGNYAAAADALSDAIAANPQRENSVAMLILMERQLNRLDAAEQAYIAALERGVDGVDMHFNMGNFYLEQGRGADAKTALARVLKINPQHADALALVGYIAQRSAEPGRAAELYRRALQAEPGHKQAGYELGRLLALNGEHAAAIQQIEALLTPADEDTPRFLTTLAGIHASAGDLGKAIALLEQATAMLPSDSAPDTTALRDRIAAERRQFIELRDSGGARPAPASTPADDTTP